MINRQERIKLFKHRSAKGFIDTSWTWNKWNDWFHKQPEALQLYMYKEMLQGEDKMRFMGQDLTATQVTNRVNSLLDCCPTTSTPCKTGPCSPTCEMTWPDHSKCAAVQSPCTPFAWKVPAKKQEEEQKMSYNQIGLSVANCAVAKSEIATQRDFLTDTLSTIYWTKRNDPDLRRAFGLLDDEAPKTIKERKARIDAGMFIINFDYGDDEFDEDEEHYGMGRGQIRWRDPAKKEDRDGYTALLKTLDEEKTKILRIIQIKDAEAGLAAVEAFEAKNFIPATVH